MGNAEDRLKGKLCLVTGGTAGIGFVTARKLAEAGAHIFIVGRDATRGQNAADTICTAAGRQTVDFLQADLSDQDEIHRLATSVMDRHGKLDVLVNNAGSMFGRRSLSAQGLEMTFALNHLSYFTLTLLLLPALEAAAPARIVNVASQAHQGVELDFDDLQSEHGYSAWTAYKRSKLANLLFTHELAHRLDWQRITVNALHPGFVATGIGVRNGFIPGIVWWLAKFAAISVEDGAQTPFYLASAPEVAGVHGRYFEKCQPRTTSHAARDRQSAARLWERSVEITGLEKAAPDRIDNH
ncbi:MAG: SDR family oxidoreductase [Hyphomicrobiales bacterium]|nr:SDR family oxidoreductase [Hyphomicrobiales bacterium]